MSFEGKVRKLASTLSKEAEEKGLVISWETIERNYGLTFDVDERDRIKRYWKRLFPPDTEITVQWGVTIPKAGALPNEIEERRTKLLEKAEKLREEIEKARKS